MTTIPDFGQTHETCGMVKLVKWVPILPQEMMKRKNQRKQKPQQTNYKKQQKVKTSVQSVPETLKIY